MSDARTVAARVLARSLKDGAFAAAALDTELERSDLDARDRAFATELTYGTLRVFPYLESRIAAHATRGIDTLTPETRAHLAIGAYQIFFTRVPAFAAVDAAVTNVRKDTEGASGFANAVLRKLAKEERPDMALAVEQSVPAWLRRSIEKSLGADAKAFFADMANPPPIGLRSEIDRDALLERLKTERPHGSFELGKVSPLAILARGIGRPQDLAAYKSGELSIQEEGSQALALALGAQKGERVLDACAGRGGKTGILARVAEVDACDLHANKLEQLKSDLARLKLSARTHVVDWTKGSDLREYDRVLVDAPCSGSGTLRRRPDISLHRRREDVRRLAGVQLEILQRTSKHVRKGGTLLYAVCSVLREEGEGVIERFLADKTFEKTNEQRFVPWEHGTDGYFLATFVRLS